MYILNSKERNEAFFKFLFFFLLTSGLIVLAVFFNYRMPTSENRMLLDEVNIQRKQEMDQQKFVTRMEETIQLLDSMDKEKVNYDQINRQLQGNIQDLSALQQKDNTVAGKLNKAIISKFDELRTAKMRLREMTDKTVNLSTLKQDLKDCKDEVKSLNASLDKYEGTDQ